MPSGNDEEVGTAISKSWIRSEVVVRESKSERYRLLESLDLFRGENNLQTLYVRSFRQLETFVYADTGDVRTLITSFS